MLLLWSTTLALADTDVGDIAVIETDATIIPEAFDLDDMSLEFTPNAEGGYTVRRLPLTFENDLGDPLSFPSDGSMARTLSFPFSIFHFQQSSTIFIGTNGCVTFAPDSQPRASLRAFAASGPRLAVLWHDIGPGSTGVGRRVLFNDFGDRAVVTWQDVPASHTSANTFQVVLLANGTIRMSYNGVDLRDGFVGVSPGNSGNELFGLSVDFTADSPAAVIASGRRNEFIGQVFVDPNHPAFIPTIPLQAVARKFYQSHADVFDQLVMFTSFDQQLEGGSLAFELTVKSSVQGIGQPAYNRTASYGSAGRLQSVLNMNNLNKYPDDPQQIFFTGIRHTLAILGEETGHRWLAKVAFREGGVDKPDLLGRAGAHWSFFVDTDASVMEGNEWEDGNGTFTTVAATQRFSPLDQYLMGLRRAVDVPDFFYIAAPGRVETQFCRRRRPPPYDLNLHLDLKNCSPEVGVTTVGTRRTVTVDQIIAAEGLRQPPSGFSTENPTTVWRQAFILLSRPGQTPVADIDRLERIRAAWVPYFAQATDFRGSVDTNLRPPPSVSQSRSSSGGSGGCTGSANAEGDPTLASVMGFIVAFLSWKRIKRR
jgi:hypothetical protein